MELIRIVIVGAGFGGTYTLRKLHQFFHNDARVRITLVSEKNYFLFTPLLHEVATGGVNPENIVEPIRKILGCCLHEFFLGKAIRLDLEGGTMETTAGVLQYDYLVLAPGAETNFYDTPGAREYSFTLKSLEDAVRLKNHCIAQVERASHLSDRNTRRRTLRFIVVGGGPTGVELAAELHEFLKQTFSGYYAKEIIEDISVILVQKAAELLPKFAKSLQKKSLEVLRKKGIEVLLKTHVTQVRNDAVEFADGKILFTETVVWVAGIQPASIPFAMPAARESDGRLTVNQYLQLDGHSHVFALGDAAGAKTEHGALLPALAQVAAQEANTVAENIRRHIADQTLKPFSYRNAGTLVSLGQWMAVGEISTFTLWGHLAWWIWRAVYLSKLISRRKKIKVAVDWTLNLFSPRDISQL